MKKELKTKIKSFLKAQKNKIYLPFVDFSTKKLNSERISQKMLSILPNLQMEDNDTNFSESKTDTLPVNVQPFLLKNKNEQVSQRYHSPFLQNKKINFIQNYKFTNNNEPLSQSLVSNFILPDKQEEKPNYVGAFYIPKRTKLNYGMELKLVNTPNPIKFLVNAPKRDKEKILNLIKSKKINNKLEKLSTNEFVITLPAYADGKNMLNIGNGLVKSIGRVTSSFISATKKEDPTTKLNQNVFAKLEEGAKVAGGSEPPKITLLGENTNSTTDKEAAIVGESGKELIKQEQNAVIPESTQQTTVLPESTQQTSTNEKQEKQENYSNKALDTLSTAAMFIPGIGQIGMAAKALGGLSKIGNVGKMLGMSKGAIIPKNSMGGLSSLTEQNPENKTSSPTEGSSNVLGSIGSALPGAALTAGGVGVAAAGANLAIGAVGAGVGIAAKGLGALASGIGSLMENSPGMQIMKSVLGDEEKEKKSNAIAQDNRVSNTTFNNVVHNYDIYRKTADDSFMLPNYRREYG